jgi:serine/threonine-protein kinase
MTGERHASRLRWSVAAFAGSLVAIVIAIVTLGMRHDESPVTEVPVPAAAVAPAALVAARPEPREAPVRLGTTSVLPVEQTPAETPAPSTEPVAAPGAPAVPAMPAMIDVAVDSSPSGAEVVLDGAVQGITPFAGHLPRGNGDITLVVRLAGYVDQTLQVHLAGPIRERVTLARKPGVAAPKHATPVRDRSFNPFD